MFIGEEAACAHEYYVYRSCWVKFETLFPGPRRKTLETSKVQPKLKGEDTR